MHFIAPTRLNTHTYTHTGCYGFLEEGGALIIPAPQYFSRMEVEYRDRQGESENAPQRRGEGLAPPNVAVNRSQREGGGFAADTVQTVTLH